MDYEKSDHRSRMLINRVKKNQRRLKNWRVQHKVSCFRLYDKDIPEIPLIVDWYDGRLHISVLERGTGDDDEVTLFEFEILKLAEALGVNSRDVFVKGRRRQRGAAQYERVDKQRRLVQVREGGLTFTVNLSDYLDTGLFLDHRITRGIIKEEARGKRFLNLFGYTGAFSVYAAAGGAATTSTVDLSNTYLDWAELNMEQNGFEGSKHRFIRDDILSVLDNKMVKGPFDLVIIDPPTTSRSKAMERDFDVQRDHTKMLSRVIDICTTGAVIYFSTNFRGFKLNEKGLNGVDVADITEKTIPPDFRNRKIHRCFRMVKL